MLRTNGYLTRISRASRIGRKRMPNWVDNRLTISGNPKDIKKLKEQLAQPYSETIDSFDTTTKQMVRQVITHDEPFSF